MALPSLIFPTFVVAFRVPSAMWGICGVGGKTFRPPTRNWRRDPSFSLQFIFFGGENWMWNIFKSPTISCNYWCFSVSKMTISWNTCWLIALLTPCLWAVGHNLRPTSPTQDPSNANKNGSCLAFAQLGPSKKKQAIAHELNHLPRKCWMLDKPRAMRWRDMKWIYTSSMDKVTFTMIWNDTMPNGSVTTSQNRWIPDSCVAPLPCNGNWKSVPETNWPNSKCLQQHIIMW